MNDMTMVPCDHVIAKLWEYLDLGPDAPDSDEIRRHLEVCGRCFPEYDFRRAYLRFMRRCKAEEVPAPLRRQIFAMILEQENGEKAGGETPEGLFERGRKFLRRRPPDR